MTPQPGLPNLPVARPRLMHDSTFSTPLVWCSMPRACSSIPVAAVPQQLGGLLDARRRDAGDRARPTPACSRATAAAASSKPVGVVADEVVVEPVALDQHVEDRAHQRRVGARPEPEEDVGGARDRRHARVGDDQLGAAVARPPDVAGGDRRALGDVRAGDEDDVGERDVAPRVASRGRCRAPSCSPRRPTPCRAGRCSRGSRCRAPRRANLPIR